MPDIPNQPSSATSLEGIDVAAAYDRWSAQYDNDRNATRDLDAQVLRANRALAVTDRSVVEIGCGTGKNTKWLAEHAAALTAMDFSAGMLAVAEREISNRSVRFIQHDVRVRWPLEDNSVDTIVGNLVLEHVEHLPAVFAEAARVLRSGGQLYLCELHPYRQWRGGQAHFTEQSSGDVIHVSAYVHSISDYVHSALANGFALTELGEHLESDAPAGSYPRLLSLLFQLR